MDDLIRDAYDLLAEIDDTAYDLELVRNHFKKIMDLHGMPSEDSLRTIFIALDAVVNKMVSHCGSEFQSWRFQCRKAGLLEEEAKYE